MLTLDRNSLFGKINVNIVDSKADKHLMRKSDIKILLVEDDQTAGKAMLEGIKRLGFDARWAAHPDEARAMFKINDFKMVILDCLLPKTNGVDFALELKKLSDVPFAVVLTSGVYRDKNFSREAVDKTGASAFLAKPIALDKLNAIIADAVGEFIDEEREPLEDYWLRPEVTEDLRKRVLEKTTGLSGFELPNLLSVILQSHISGHLNLILKGGELASIHFHKGSVTFVNKKDSASLFGVLMIEMGAASAEEIQATLELQSDKPIGQRLIEANLVSPHVVDLAVQEQMFIRITQMIQDATIEVSFTEQPVPSSTATISRAQFTAIYQEWLTSKISLDGLKTIFNPWQEHVVRLLPKRDALAEIQASKFVKKLPAKLHDIFDGGSTLHDVIDKYLSSEEKIYQALYLLLLEKLAVFDHKKKRVSDYSVQLKRLKRLLEEIDGKNPFETMGLSSTAKAKDISKRFLDLAKALHPDKIEAAAPEELKNLTAKVFALITKAHDAIGNEEGRLKTLKELEKGAAEEVLKSEAQFENGITLLGQGKAREALAIFEEVSRTKNHRSDLKVYMAWAKLKRGAPQGRRETWLEDVAADLSLVPPEERHNYLFLFVKGLFYKEAGNYKKASVNLNNAATLNPSFLDAKRELKNLAALDKPKGNEITQIVDMLFGKRRSK